MANNPAVIREKFTAILKEGKDILHIAFSSALSGSCSNVQVAANELMEEFPGRKILVFDSLNASLGEGLSVMRAVELKDSGADMQTVYDTLMEERDHINVSFTVDDLHHLQRGGRVSKTTAVLGSMINIKPVLSITATGELKANGTVRGRKKALSSLVKSMEETLDREHFGREYYAGVVHADCLKDAEYVAGLMENLGIAKKVWINDVSPASEPMRDPAWWASCFTEKGGRLTQKNPEKPRSAASGFFLCLLFLIILNNPLRSLISMGLPSPAPGTFPAPGRERGGQVLPSRPPRGRSPYP